MIIIHVRQTFDDAWGSEYGTVTSALPRPLSAGGGLKNFQCWQKGWDLHFLYFSGGVSKKGGVDFFRGPEDFLKVIFNY